MPNAHAQTLTEQRWIYLNFAHTLLFADKRNGHRRPIYSKMLRELGLAQRR